MEKICHGCYKTFYGTRCPCGSTAKSEPFDRSKYGRTEKSPTQLMQEAQDRADRAYAELKAFVRFNSRNYVVKG